VRHGGTRPVSGLLRPGDGHRHLFYGVTRHRAGRRVASVLLVDETLDAATPFEGSLEVRKLFPNSSLLAEPGGTTHAGTLFGNECVDNTIADYLATGALPARKRGNGPDVQRYVYGKIYNAKAYNLCSQMPRLGYSGTLTEQQIKDLVGLLLDPASPVNH